MGIVFDNVETLRRSCVAGYSEHLSTAACMRFVTYRL